MRMFTKGVSLEVQGVDLDEINRVNQSPVVKLTDEVIVHAVKIGASDIHIEPYENKVRIRIRINGVLNDMKFLTKELYKGMMVRIKVLAGMDIAEKRVPQDGRILYEFQGRNVDLRVASLPTITGEKIVIRLLDKANQIDNIEDIGLNNKDIEKLNKVLAKMSGIILVSGPTGSGKSTTLNAIVNNLNSQEYNIVTIEEPVEFLTYGINQVSIDNNIGLDFSKVLRAVLRQDPDVIMVGEIRDKETAEIAIRAGITGHLVLSTIHTMDAVSTYTRLVDMGVEPYLLAHSISCIISQRLIRVLCKNCKVQYKPSSYEKKILKLKEDIPLYKAKGCLKCFNTGYESRTGVFEILIPDDEINDLVTKSDGLELKKYCIKKRMRTLNDSCLDLVKRGVTSFDEIIKMCI